MIDILNLELESYPSRDINITTPVCNYLKYKGFSVKRGCVFEGRKLIYKYKPKVVYLSNGIGDPIKHNLVKFAKNAGCKVVTGVSEGNILPKDVHQKFWGWNKDEIMYEDLNLQWSNRARDLIIQKYPEYKEKIKVTGAVGFDLYKIINNRSSRKKNFKLKYNIPEKMPVVGFACYNFGNFYKEDYYGYRIIQNFYTKSQIDRFKSDGQKLNEILLNIIEDNPNFFFLIKEHPNSRLGDLASAISGVRKYKNVLVLKSEESIADCINVCDIWLGYETTSVIEAWLSGLPTILINPSGFDFPRYSFFEGSVISTNTKETNYFLNLFFSEGKIDAFDKKKKEREREIEKVIQWSDGLNHVRAGNYIIKLLKSNNSKIRYNFKNLFEIFYDFLNLKTFFGLIHNKGTNKNRKKYLNRFSLKELYNYEKQLYNQQLKLYKEKNCC